MQGFKTLEDKYGITVERYLTYVNPVTSKRTITYDVYSYNGHRIGHALSKDEIKKKCEKEKYTLLKIRRDIKQEQRRKEREIEHEQYLEMLSELRGEIMANL